MNIPFLVIIGIIGGLIGYSIGKSLGERRWRSAAASKIVAAILNQNKV